MATNNLLFVLICICVFTPVDIFPLDPKTGHELKPELRAVRQTNTDTESDEKTIIYGFRAEGDPKDQWIDAETGRIFVRTNSDVDLRLIGTDLDTNGLQIGLTLTPPQETYCNPPEDKRFTTKPSDSEFEITATIRLTEEGRYYVCYGLKDKLGWVHVWSSDSPHFQIEAEGPLIPLWLQILLILILLTCSGLFSGLNLGLMSLDKNELKVIERCGTEQEKQYAKNITPVRKRGNYLLCTLLLGNVLVNSSLTILLDDLTTGLIAVVASTLLIVVFGEIIPQALCARHGLAVGARTVWLTYIFMVVTFPLSFLISKVLDKILGEEIGKVYDRERLMEYIRVTKDHNKLEPDEVNIISGALKISKITVVEIMTPINDVFMLPYNQTLNYKTMTDIKDSGYSRIPVYMGHKKNIVGILHAKDLVFTDPDESILIKTLIDRHLHTLYFVYSDTPLLIMLNEFRLGKSHIAFVQTLTDELVGVVTLEDIIEDIINVEINDETDVISDNRRKQKRKKGVFPLNPSDSAPVEAIGGSDVTKESSEEVSKEDSIDTKKSQ